MEVGRHNFPNRLGLTIYGCRGEQVDHRYVIMTIAPEEELVRRRDTFCSVLAMKDLSVLVEGERVYEKDDSLLFYSVFTGISNKSPMEIDGKWSILIPGENVAFRSELTKLDISAYHHFAKMHGRGLGISKAKSKKK